MRISFSWGVGSFPEEERGFLREFDQKKLWSKYLVNISTLFWSRDYFLAGRIGLRIRRVIARLSMTRLVRP